MKDIVKKKKVIKPKMPPRPPRVPSDIPIMCCFGFKPQELPTELPTQLSNI